MGDLIGTWVFEGTITNNNNGITLNMTIQLLFTDSKYQDTTRINNVTTQIVFVDTCDWMVTDNKIETSNCNKTVSENTDFICQLQALLNTPCTQETRGTLTQNQQDTTSPTYEIDNNKLHITGSSGHLTTFTKVQE